MVKKKILNFYKFQYQSFSYNLYTCMCMCEKNVLSHTSID